MAASCGCRVLEPPCAHTGRPCRGTAHVLCYRGPVWVFATPPGCAWSTVVVVVVNVS